MARVTVEDCVDKVTNRFELVLLSAHRAREMSAGAELTVDRDNDKNPVVALREIADETIAAPDLHESLVSSLQSHNDVDEPEPESMGLLMSGGEIGAASSDDVPGDRMSEEELLKALQDQLESADAASSNDVDSGVGY